MLIATVPYVGKRLHLDPDPKLNYGSGSEHANNFESGSTTLAETLGQSRSWSRHIEVSAPGQTKVVFKNCNSY
jgi:hypothetical protein